MVTRGRGSTGRYLTSRGRTSADAGRDTPGTQYHGKRILDLATLSLLAIPAVVLGAICALAIWLEDGPPVFFRQVRAGRGGRPFVLLKLRTMTSARHRSDAFPEPASITRTGRLLRRLSIDELPQLINVLRGEMSLVGPRPTLPYQVQRYDSRQLGRLRVRPGLTGLAQVHGRNRMSWPERIEWDLRYVENQSLRLDLAVLACTVRVILTGDGVAGHSRHDPIAQVAERRCAVPEVMPRIRLAKPDIGAEEIESVRAVLTSGTLTDGPQNAAFEREFADRHSAGHGVTFASGTVALAAMLLAEHIGPGDEVIVPSMTFVSTATCVRHVGATPVFADIDPRSFNLDPAEIARLVTRKTRAVLTVHYAGQPGELDQLQKTCADHGLLLLEDAAEATGAEFRGIPVGTFGKSAMFSFTPTKNITTGEGGLVLTSDAETADRLRLLRNHGQPSRYQHVLIGYNWRLTEMQAAIGRAQLRKLDAILARKRANAGWMSRRLAHVPGITPPYQVPHASSPHMLYTCLVAGDRDAVLDHLVQRGIEARIYFPPVHLQPIFADRDRRLPVTEAVAAQMLSIPMHSQLTPDELAQIADTVEEAIGQADRARSRTLPTPEPGTARAAARPAAAAQPTPVLQPAPTVQPAPTKPRPPTVQPAAGPPAPRPAR
ncbi:MAG TPA: aminotransferase class I/II-fold pyridoxal phosphate-dependent enzyme [Streptosporangiaceae bacterium]|nr:aminotransferase class I/II-fold pyridoxal phosphate-dependent enzyme [Streptosporangiaceae bacterium]